MEESVQQLQKDQITNDKGSTYRWRGMKPFLRLIHVITDNDDIKQDFILSFECLERDELDGVNNPHTARKNIWDTIAEKFNDNEYNPSSDIYENLCDDFKESIDLSYDIVVANGTGNVDSNKVYSKYMETRSQMNDFISKFERSGQGAGDHRGVDFLGTSGTHVLYWKRKAEENGILDEIAQKMHSHLAMSSGVDNSALQIRAEKKKPTTKHTESLEFLRRREEDYQLVRKEHRERDEKDDNRFNKLMESNAKIIKLQVQHDIRELKRRKLLLKSELTKTKIQMRTIPDVISRSQDDQDRFDVLQCECDTKEEEISMIENDIDSLENQM